MKLHYGIVESIKDPAQLGRVRVRVMNTHTPDKNKVKTEDLPWSLVMAGTTTPGVSGIGHSSYLLQGAWVVGVFMDNDMQDFMVMGSLPTVSNSLKNPTTMGFTDPDGKYPRKVKEPDNNTRARGEVSRDPQDEVVGLHMPASSYNPKYPYNHVYETESGHVKEYDDTPGSERIQERHRSGTFYEMNPDGSKVERINGPNYQLVVGDDTLEVIGSVNIITSGDVKLSCAGNLDTFVQGNISVKTLMHTDIDINGLLNIGVGENITINTLKSVNINAQDDINIQAYKTLNLNAEDDITITSKKNIKLQSGVPEGKIYLND
jgi:hypothetical protein